MPYLTLLLVVGNADNDLVETLKRYCNNERVVWDRFAGRGLGYVWNQRDMQRKFLRNGFIISLQVQTLTTFIQAFSL